MKLNININLCNSCNECKLTIEDNTEYLPESHTGVELDFKKSQTISIDVIQYNKSKETVYGTPYFSVNANYNEIPVDYDGWFTVIHLVLPSKDWFNTELNKTSASGLTPYNIVYYTDGEFIYKYQNKKSVTVPIEEILLLENPIGTTIARIDKDYVSICYLRKCYINLCLQIFESRGFSSCWNNNKIDSELVFKRDLVWMSINVIKYLVECSQLAEAERIIEVLNGCNGVCSNNTSKNKTNGCGCSK